MSRSHLTQQEAYEKALYRTCGGLMPNNLYEQSRRSKPRRKAKKRTKKAKRENIR